MPRDVSPSGWAALEPQILMAMLWGPKPPKGRHQRQTASCLREKCVFESCVTHIKNWGKLLQKVVRVSDSTNTDLEKEIYRKQAPMRPLIPLIFFCLLSLKRAPVVNTKIIITEKGK